MIHLEEKIKQIKLQSKMFDFSWVQSQKEENSLYIEELDMGFIPITDTIIEQLRIFIKNIQIVYDDNWDFEIFGKEKNGKEIIVLKGFIFHFPEIEISNTLNEKHTITDLFTLVWLKSKHDRLIIYGLQGARSTLTYAEFSSGYIHSHLSYKQYNNWNSSYDVFTSFCTGSGEINIYQADFNEGMFNESKILPYLVQIISLVRHESLEGTPYIKMRNISIHTREGRQRYAISHSRIINFYVNLIQRYKSTNTTPNLNFTLENNTFVLQEDNTFLEWLRNGVRVLGFENSILCFLGGDNNYYNYGEIASENTYYPIPNDVPPIIFRGEEKIFTVTEIIEQDSEIQREYVLHPTTISIIKNRINNDINKKTIRQSTINRYSN